MMVDPDGELAWFVIPVIVGAVTGGINVATNWSAIQAAGGGWSFFGAAAASFGVGFAAGAGATLGAAAAAPALTAALGTGAASGAALGAIGGGISGFTLGAGNTWMNGGSFFNGFGAGIGGAGMGALAGGITGGTFSGVKSLIQGKNFWTGVPKTGAGITYNKLDVDRPNLGSEFPQRELAKVEMGSAARNPTAGPSSLGNNTINTGNLRIDLEMGRAVRGNMQGLNSFSSLTDKFGPNYQSIAVTQGKHIPVQLGQKLYLFSNGSWSKIYEAGILHGSKVEVHYFYNSTKGQIVNPFIKYGNWGSRGLKGITGY